MDESRPASGNILVYAKVHNAEAKARLRQRLEDLSGERISAAIYEVDAADWDAGLWDEVIEQMRDIVDQDVDTLIYWQVIAGKLVRTCICGRKP